MTVKMTIAGMTIAGLLLCGAAKGQDEPAAPGAGMAAQDGMQQKLAQMRAAQARNTGQLHHFQWLESTTVTVNGHQAPPKQALCRYAPDGSMLKTPMASGAVAPEMRGGPLRRHIMENKMEEAKTEVEEVSNLVHSYLPRRPEQMQEIMRSGRISIERDAAGMELVLHDYAKPGDQMRLTLDRASMQIVRITVTSYFEKPKDAMTATVQFATLPDGTMYPSLTTIEAPGKKVSLMTTNADYVRIIQ